MPANLLPNEAIAERAARIDSPAMLKMLRFLKLRGFIMNSPDVDKEAVAVLKRLAALGLVDPGYDGSTNGEPFVWVSNANGKRLLKHFQDNRRYQIQVQPLAQTLLESLSEADREAVWAYIDFLLIRDRDSWPHELAVRLNPDRPVYMLMIPPDLRPFITILAPGEVELSDILREGTLRPFLERDRTGVKAG